MGASVFFSSAINSQSSSSNQFHALISALEQLGYLFTDNPNSDFYIGVNHVSRDYKRFIKYRGNKLKAALIRLEPPSVFPYQYKKVLEAKYGLIMSPGRVHGLSKRADFLPWPYEVTENPQQPVPSRFPLNQYRNNALHQHFTEFNSWLKRKNELILVAANKVSPNKVEQYSIRRRYAKHLPNEILKTYGDLWNSSLLSKIDHRARILNFSLRNCYFPNLISLYGNLHWSYKSSLGLIDQKSLALGESRFSLVVENDPSYVSEKLMDALIHGTIPFYLGPSLELTGIPSNVVIPLNHTPEELECHINSISEDELFIIWQNIRKFLSSKSNFIKWDKNAVYSSISLKLHEFFGAERL